MGGVVLYIVCLKLFCLHRMKSSRLSTVDLITTIYHLLLTVQPNENYFNFFVYETSTFYKTENNNNNTIIDKINK